MPEGKTIEYADGEYPQLDGLEAGAPVKFTGQATIQDNGDGTKALLIESMEFETEGMADRELKKMKGEDRSMMSPSAGGSSDGDDF